MIRIMVVDDDEDDRLLFEEALAESRLLCDLQSAVDGEDLLNQLNEAIDAELPDLILLDLNMPRMDGKEALEEIKKEKRLRAIPVVILTTSRAEEDIVESYNIGASSYIPKPVTFDGLRRKILSLTDYWFDVVRLPTRR